MRAKLSPRLTPFCRRQGNKINSKSELRCNYHTETRGNHAVLLCDGVDPIPCSYDQHEALQRQEEGTDLCVSAT